MTSKGSLQCFAPQLSTRLEVLFSDLFKGGQYTVQ